MKRVFVLATLLTVGALTLAVSASQQPPPARLRRPRRGRRGREAQDNLFMLTGGGGNTAVFVGAVGRRGRRYEESRLGPADPRQDQGTDAEAVTTIINTHTHGDHVSGNVEFPATVEVVAHENTAANMQEMRAATQPRRGQPPNIFKANNGRGLPKRTFKDRMTLGSGADRIDLYYFGRGHTNGDAWVVFPALRVMHAGDIFSGKNIPVLDAVNGGSGLASPTR